jgi:hypothetical protein
MVQMAALRKAQAELARAHEARSKGNEGMARVCARRAAGYALAAYVESQPDLKWGVSAVSRLAGLAQDETQPGEIRSAAERLTARLTPEHTLPFDEDPLADAQAVIGHVERLLA